MIRDDYWTDDYEENLFDSRYRDTPNETTWEDRFLAVADVVPDRVPSDAGARAADYYGMMASGAVMPSSPQLWNYGSTRPFPRSGSSCYTVPIEDSLAGFERADHEATTIYVSSGGAGFLFDPVRPRGCRVRRSISACVGVMGHGGPLRRLESRTGYITNGGRERGAMMAQLSVTHPDVIEFILAKVPVKVADGDALAAALAMYDGTQAVIDAYGEPSDERKRAEAGKAIIRQLKQIDARAQYRVPLQNCNMSVRATDCFMRAVERDLPWVLSWFSEDAPKPDEAPHTVLDGDDVDPTTVLYADDGSVQVLPNHTGRLRRYGVVLTTWEAVKVNLLPNPHNWKDREYAAYHHDVLVPWLAQYSGPIMARDLWDLIGRAAHNHADPGIVFSDTYERFNPVSLERYGPRYSNPCSEYVNSKKGSCNLASVNLRWCAEYGLRSYSMVEAQRPGSAGTLLDAVLGAVRAQTERATRYLNDALEHNRAPIATLDHHGHRVYRTIGVGLMGLAEALIIARTRYGSDEGVRVAALLMSEIGLTAWETSFAQAMDEDRRAPEAWDPERMAAIFGRRVDLAIEYLLPASHLKRWGALRSRVFAGDCATNTCVTSVAPAGSISQIVAWLMGRAASNGIRLRKVVTGGVEPVFAAHTGRQDNSGSTTMLHDLFVGEDREESPWLVTAPEVAPQDHIRMQAAVAAFCDMSVSKTINLPPTATVEDVQAAYRLAWALGIPGTTVYRDGSKPMQVLTNADAGCPNGECAIDLPGLPGDEIAPSRAGVR